MAYALFAIATILVGALIGLIFVCIVDVIIPQKHTKHDQGLSMDEIRSGLSARQFEDFDDDVVEEPIPDVDYELVSNSEPESSEAEETEKSGEEGTPKKSAKKSQKKESGIIYVFSFHLTKVLNYRPFKRKPKMLSLNIFIIGFVKTGDMCC